MSNRDEKIKVPFKRISFTQEEINQVKKEANGDFSRERRMKWLEMKGAVKLRDYYGHLDMRVIQLPDGSFPYSTLSDLWEAVLDTLRRSEYASQKKIEFYDKIEDLKTSFTPIVEVPPLDEEIPLPDDPDEEETNGVNVQEVLSLV